MCDPGYTPRPDPTKVPAPSARAAPRCPRCKLNTLRVALVTPDLRQSSGGPARNIPRLGAALARDGLEVELFFAGEAQEQEPDGVRYVPCRTAYPSRLGRSPDLKRRLLASRAEVIHASGLWMRPLAYAAQAALRLRAPLVVSPRGMLSPWSLRRSPWRKWMAAQFVHRGAFRQVAGWHATSVDEEADIRGLGFGQPICVAPNGIEPPAGPPDEALALYRRMAPETPGRRVLLFYSRFHSKKRVRELVGDFAALAPKHPDWHLLAVGVPEEYGVAFLREEAQACGVVSRVTILDGRGLPKPFAVADLFVLPSHNENFGQVVAEALAAGVPVLTTEGTPWSDLERVGAGRRVTLLEMVDALDSMMSWPQARLREAGSRGRDWVLREFTWTEAASRLARFYARLAAVV